MSTSWAFWVWPFFIIPIERGFRLVVLMLRIFSSLCSKILSAKISLLSSLWPLPENKKQDMKSFEIDWQCFLLSYQLKKGIMKKSYGIWLAEKRFQGSWVSILNASAWFDNSSKRKAIYGGSSLTRRLSFFWRGCRKVGSVVELKIKFTFILIGMFCSGDCGRHKGFWLLKVSFRLGKWGGQGKL